MQGATVVVVDDGVATGVTAMAALRWVRAEGASAAGVRGAGRAPGRLSLLAPECDECLILHTPTSLRAVGEWYDVFDQTTDDEVRAAIEARTGRTATREGPRDRAGRALRRARRPVARVLGAAAVREPGLTDHVLFAMFVTGEVGWWFAASGLFALYATMGEQGDVAVTVRRYDWYLLLLISLAALQFVSGFILGRRTSDR